jgi:hypothetical protein
VISFATASGKPARERLRAAQRLKSWTKVPSSPLFWHALGHDFLTPPIL